MIDPPLPGDLQINNRSVQPRVRSLSFLWSSLAKRAFDVILAFIGLIFLAPFFVLVSILVRRDSPGPAFYRGPRMGKKGRVFQILKFRTMYESPESYEGPHVTGKGDDRITPLGHWLRNTKINELPQLWNVLIGDMSLVGPRPEHPEIMRALPQSLRGDILSTRPGITSPASVVYHSEENLLAQTDLMGLYLNDILPDKLRLDQLYVSNRSLASDLDIIFWTMTIFIPRIARTKIPEGYIFAGPFTRLLHRYVSWFIADSLTALVAAGIIGVLWRSQSPINWGFEYLGILAVCLALLFSGVNAVSGLNRVLWSRATIEDGMGLAFSSGSVTLLALALNYLAATYAWLPIPPLPPAMIISIGLLAQIGFVATRYRLRLLAGVAESWLNWRRNVPGVGERVLIVGEGEGCEIANWLLKRGMFRHVFSVVGMVASDDPTKQGMRLHGCWMLGGIGDLQTLTKKHDVRMIVYTIPSADGEVRKIVFDHCKTSNIRLVFLDDLLGLVDQHLGRPATATEYAWWLQERLESMSMQDSLTGLPNRSLLQDRLRQSLVSSKRYQRKPAVLFIGLQGLVAARAMGGQKFVDELLTIAAKRLMTVQRESDTLGRYNAEEFALLLQNISSREAVDIITRRINGALSKPFSLRGKRISLTADLSICLCDDERDETTSRYSELDLCYARKKKTEPFGLKLVATPEWDHGVTST